MSTINISLPQEQVSIVDKLLEKYNFASRSEFFRHLLRIVVHKPHIMEDASVFPFPPTPPNQSVRDVMADFKATKKYSKAFLKDLEEGLKRSDYFKP